MFYVSPDVTSRFSGFYGQTYVPNHFTDGLVNRIGSGNYDNYVADYEARRSVPAPLAITVLEKTLTSTTCYVKVRVTLEESLPSGHDIYVGLWEDHLVVGGTYGETPTRVIERALATTPLTITDSGQSQGFEKTFDVDPGWNQGNIGTTAWVQGPNTDAEVHNATAAKVSAIGIAPSSLGRIKALYQ